MILLMNKSKINFDDLIKTINGFNKLKVHVVGDTIIDTYTRTSLLGSQAKTPTFSCLYQTMMIMLEVQALLLNT